MTIPDFVKLVSFVCKLIQHVVSRVCDSVIVKESVRLGKSFVRIIVMLESSYYYIKKIYEGEITCDSFDV